MRQGNTTLTATGSLPMTAITSQASIGWNLDETEIPLMDTIILVMIAVLIVALITA